MLLWFCVDMHLIRISVCLLDRCFNQCCLLNWTLLYLICFLIILGLIVISPKLSIFSALSCVFQRPAWPDSKRSDQVHFMQLPLCTLHSFVDKQVPMLIWGDIHPTLVRQLVFQIRDNCCLWNFLRDINRLAKPPSGDCHKSNLLQTDGKKRSGPEANNKF